MNWTAIIWACVVVAFFCFLVGLFGCTPSANFAAYGSALNGQFNQPLYYPYYSTYNSGWMGPPRLSCMNLGSGVVSCRQI